MIRSVAAGALLFVFALTGCSSDERLNSEGSPGALQSRTVQAGEVEVVIDPVTITDDGATFDVSFDTHSVELDLDVADESRFEVDGERWTKPIWDGDPPSGHHREGRLSFTAVGAAEGTARLEIGGLPEPVEATWEIG